MSAVAATASGATSQAVRERIRALTGLVFPANRLDALAGGLQRSMRRALALDPQEYLARVERDPALLDDLVAEITVGETYFFRDPEQCRVIRERILPELFEARGGEPLRVWSAGCGTGEEAYTLAILLAEAGARGQVAVVGTDLSRRALARAREGRYTRWALRGVPPEQVARYFSQEAGEFVLGSGIRRQADFRYLNLVEDAYPSLASGISGMDLILCRNVLIYFDAATSALVIRRLMRALAPGGWLLLGASDPVPADRGPCEVVLTGAGLAYRRVGTAPATTPTALDAAGMTSAAPEIPKGTLLPPPEAPAFATPVPATRPEVEAPPPRAAARSVRGPRTPDLGSSAGDADAAIARVRALANGGDLVTAGRACAEALDRHRTSAELTYVHGVLLGEAGRPAEAAAALRAALYLDRTLAVAHLALARELARLADGPGALRALRNAERLLAACPEDTEVPASDGERAGRLLAAARAHVALLTRGDA